MGRGAEKENALRALKPDLLQLDQLRRFTVLEGGNASAEAEFFLSTLPDDNLPGFFAQSVVHDPQLGFPLLSSNVQSLTILF